MGTLIKTRVSRCGSFAEVIQMNKARSSQYLFVHHWLTVNPGPLTPQFHCHNVCQRCLLCGWKQGAKGRTENSILVTTGGEYVLLIKLVWRSLDRIEISSPSKSFANWRVVQNHGTRDQIRSMLRVHEMAAKLMDSCFSSNTLLVKLVFNWPFFGKVRFWTETATDW